MDASNAQRGDPRFLLLADSVARYGVALSSLEGLAAPRGGHVPALDRRLHRADARELATIRALADLLHYGGTRLP